MEEDILESVDLKSLFEAAPGFIAVVEGPDHVFKVANAAYRRLAGKPELIGRPAREAMPELVAQGYIELLDQVYRSGKPHVADNVPVSVTQCDGSSSTRILNFVYQPMRNAQGNICGIFAEGIDVTAPAEVEQARVSAERRLDAVLNNASVSIFLMDERQTCVFMNAAAERLTGYTLAETQGRPLHDVIHHTRPDGSHFPIEECAIDRAFPENNNVQGEEVFVHKDGHFIPVAFTASPVRDEESRTVGTIIEVRDISAEKAVTAALEQSHERLLSERRALEILNDTGTRVAAELDLDKLVQTVVDAAVTLTEAEFGAFFYNVERNDGERLMLYALSGAKMSDFERFGMPRPTSVFAPTFKGEGVIRSDDITQDPRYGLNAPHAGMPPGHLPVRSYLAVPVTGRDGEVMGGLFFGHSQTAVFDERSEKLITGLAAQAAIGIDNARLYGAAQLANMTLEERIRTRTAELEDAHEALRHSQKMEAIGQLTGGIAHDFNNLLTVILGSADILRRPDLSDEKRTRYIDAIGETAERAAKLTSQLLAFARRQSLEPTVFDVVDRIRSVTTVIAPVLGSRIVVEVDGHCDPCFTRADVTQLETAILNMSVNARDAMNGEGKLTFSVSVSDEIPSVNGVAGRVGEYVAIRITDTGCGIEADSLSRIFEPFFTTKMVGQGTGLGLSQVFGFAKQSGGEVRVESEVSVGTTFALYLPKVDEPIEGNDSVADPLKSEQLPRGKILVVEDNAHVGEFATQLLADLGYESVWASDAESAFLLLKDRAFDLMFTDVVMPGMNGIELAKEFSRLRPGVPVILASGYSHVLAEEGSHGFPLLQKPYSVEALSQAIRDALG
jgi:PAS domain S-box-containing protein